MDADEQQLLIATLGDLAARHDGDALTDALDRFGWIDLLRNHPSVAVAALFEAQGRSGSWSSALHDVMARQFATTDAAGAAGAVSMPATSVVLPRPGQSVAASMGDDRRVELDGVLLGARPNADSFVAAATDGDGSPYIVRFPRPALSLEPQHGRDPDLAVMRVCARGGGEVVADGSAAAAWWTATVAFGRRALCHQLCGVSEAMLDLAHTHAQERRQFGRPIGSFQAVRHRLAEAHVALNGARATAEMVWEAGDEPLASMTAKLVCGRAAAVVAAHAQQVLAGVGFTAEHPYHHGMKRAAVLDKMLGSADELALLVGRELVARGDAPRLVEL